MSLRISAAEKIFGRWHKTELRYLFFFFFFFWAWRSKTWVFLMRLLGTSASCQACRKSKRTVSVEFKRIVNSNLKHFAGGKKILSLWQPPSDFVRWFMNLFKCHGFCFFFFCTNYILSALFLKQCHRERQREPSWEQHTCFLLPLYHDENRIQRAWEHDAFWKPFNWSSAF